MRFVMLSAFLLAGLCSPASAQNLRIGGTGMGLELVRGIADGFARQHTGVEIWMPESLGSGGGIKALAAGRLDVALSSRPLKEGEVKGGESVELCRTPWVFYSQASRSDVALTRADLPALFLSTLAPFVRGEVRMLFRPASESGFQYLEKTLPELKSAIEQGRQNRAVTEAITDQDAMLAVEQSRSMVGFGGLAPILAEKRKLHVVPLDGVDPRQMSEDYPHWSALYLLVGEDSSVQGRAFADYARSNQVRDLLRSNGCLPVGR